MGEGCDQLAVVVSGNGPGEISLGRLSLARSLEQV